jgi:hypothetical protein
MTNGSEKRLIEALSKVDVHGDVAPPHVHDPMTVVLRENAIRANLMRWDDTRGREARSAAKAGLALNPNFNVSRARAPVDSDERRSDISSRARTCF